MAKKKLYILDTNVLIHDPKSIFSFPRAYVGVPMVVLQELDRFKSDTSQRGFTARESIRIMDRLRTQGSLSEGVILENEGIFRVLTYERDAACLKKTTVRTADNAILATALCAQYEGYEVALITKDINMRVEADALGIIAEDYIKNTITKDEFYRGWRIVQLPAGDLKQAIPRALHEMVDDTSLVANEYIIAEAQSNPHNYRLFRYIGKGNIVPVQKPALQWSFEARNVQQLMALDALLNDDIQVVTLTGPAGTGKTLLVLVAALYKVLVEEVYTKVLVTRPIIPLGPDLGYLPGELQEKLYNWMQPVYDNMELIGHIVRGSTAGIFREQPEEQLLQNGRFHAKGNHRADEDQKWRKKHKRNTLSLSVEQLVAHDKLNLEAITYMRGRSIPYRYIFIDEVQNLTPHEVKTIVSRVGEGSKIVLAGDPYQIDSPYLDFASNGLMVVTERFNGQSIFSTVYLERSERSIISKLAAELL